MTRAWMNGACPPAQVVKGVDRRSGAPSRRHSRHSSPGSPPFATVAARAAIRRGCWIAYLGWSGEGSDEVDVVASARSRSKPKSPRRRDHALRRQCARRRLVRRGGRRAPDARQHHRVRGRQTTRHGPGRPPTRQLWSLPLAAASATSACCHREPMSCYTARPPTTVPRYQWTCGLASRRRSAQEPRVPFRQTSTVKDAKGCSGTAALEASGVSPPVACRDDTREGQARARGRGRRRGRQRL